MKIEPTVYTLDDGLTYHIDFYRTKDNISFEHYKTVKYLTAKYIVSIRQAQWNISMGVPE